MKICYDNLEKIYFTSKGTFRSKDQKTGYIYKESCKECENPFLATHKNQLFCDNTCKGKYIEKQTLANKKCKKCGETDLSKFYIRSGHLDSLCIKCRLKSGKQWRKNNPEKVRIGQRNKNRKIRKQVIEAYGGKCECCGESRYEFLALDHIYGGGNVHKRELKKKGMNIWYWLKKEGYPKDKFRILCHNCNQALASWGYCPHERERNNE